MGLRPFLNALPDVPAMCPGVFQEVPTVARPGFQVPTVAEKLP